MPDNLRPEARRRAMQAVKSTNTSLERRLAELFRRRGWRPQRNVAELPGKPDFVFPRVGLVVFVDGDFWHGWRFPQWCEKLRPYWRAKIARNRRRDLRNMQKLRRLGWKVVRVWEHQLERDPDRVLARIAEARRR